MNSFVARWIICLVSSHPLSHWLKQVHFVSEIHHSILFEMGKTGLHNVVLRRPSANSHVMKLPGKVSTKRTTHKFHLQAYGPIPSVAELRAITDREEFRSRCVKLGLAVRSQKLNGEWAWRKKEDILSDHMHNLSQRQAFQSTLGQFGFGLALQPAITGGHRSRHELLESIMANIDSMGFEEVRSMAKRLGVRTHRRKANTWRGMQELAADCRKKLSELDQLALASIMEKKKLARKMPRNGQASSSFEAHSA